MSDVSVCLAGPLFKTKSGNLYDQAQCYGVGLIDALHSISVPTMVLKNGAGLIRIRSVCIGCIGDAIASSSGSSHSHFALNGILMSRTAKGIELQLCLEQQRPIVQTQIKFEPSEFLIY